MRARIQKQITENLNYSYLCDSYRIMEKKNAVKKFPDFPDTYNPEKTNVIFRTFYRPFLRRLDNDLIYLYQAVLFGLEVTEGDSFQYWCYANISYKVSYKGTHYKWVNTIRNIPVLNKEELLPTELLNKCLVSIDNNVFKFAGEQELKTLQGIV